MYDKKLTGFSPTLREVIFSIAKFNAEDILIVVDRANITPVPVTGTFSYIVPFSMQTAAGEIIPFTGNIAATGSETGSPGGTADPVEATPPMVMGRGSVVFAGTSGTWGDTDTATLTLTYTTAYGNDKTDTWVITFTAA